MFQTIRKNYFATSSCVLRGFSTISLNGPLLQVTLYIHMYRCVYVYTVCVMLHCTGHYISQNVHVIKKTKGHSMVIVVTLSRGSLEIWFRPWHRTTYVVSDICIYCNHTFPSSSMSVYPPIFGSFWPTIPNNNNNIYKTISRCVCMCVCMCVCVVYVCINMCSVARSSRQKILNVMGIQMHARLNHSSQHRSYYSGVMWYVA